jgi:NADH-quinone oxidoreductase subunit L
MQDFLTLIVLLPLAGFVINGVLATRLGGARFGPGAVGVIACALPTLSFVLALLCFGQLQASGAPPISAQV